MAHENLPRKAFGGTGVSPVLRVVAGERIPCPR